MFDKASTHRTVNMWDVCKIRDHGDEFYSKVWTLERYLFISKADFSAEKLTFQCPYVLL
jgi:hypothetical protein